MFADGFQPTGVKATDGTFLKRVRVTFNPVPGAAVYRIFRCPVDGQTCGWPIGFSKTGSFDDKKAVAGQVYDYRVRACTVITCGKFSAADEGHIGIDDRPAIPTGINATDGAFENRVEITWNAVDGATVYRVFRCLDTGQTCGWPIGFSKTTGFDDRRGDPGKVYYYRLRACRTNICGNFSVANSGYRGSVISSATK